MRKGYVSDMTKTTGSKMLQETAYEILSQSETPLNTRQIQDRMNDKKIRTNGGAIMRTKRTYTINQVAQCLKRSRFFEKVGRETLPSASGARSPVYIYDVVDVAEQITKMLSYKHTIITPKALPKFAQEEWVRQGGVL